MPTQFPDRTAIETMVIDGLREVIAQTDRPLPDRLDSETSLIGKQAVLDSLALVTLIVDLEQRLEEEFALVLSLTDDRAMSQKSSPFRSVGAMVAYLDQLISEEQGHG